MTRCTSLFRLLSVPARRVAGNSVGRATESAARNVALRCRYRPGHRAFRDHDKGQAPKAACGSASKFEPPWFRECPDFGGSGNVSTPKVWTLPLLGGGFAFDPADKSVAWARDEGRYAGWQLPYRSDSGAGEGLRPAIKVELNYAPLRRPAVMLPVSSFVAEASTLAPEVAQLACVSIVQTAAEKLVSLTRRTAMEMAGASRDLTSIPNRGLPSADQVQSGGSRSLLATVEPLQPLAASR